ncbi:hypothetical protein NL533_32190, partial [Klebsiella pneumoniae]|nr:hypothetical protein [Klebsiella pneumoniae]
GFKQAGSLLYFAADNGSDGVELWKTDGTDTGTEMVSDIHPFDSSNPMDMYNLSDTLIFVADDGNGFELWRTNGTSTSMIQNIQPPFYD